MKSIKNEIENYIEIFFKKLKIEIDSIKIIDLEKNRYNIEIISNESNLLIWYHWNNLLALEKIIQSIINNQIEERPKIRLKINNYLTKKDEALFLEIDNKIKSLLNNNENKNENEIKLQKYSPYERKKIHSYISKQKNNFSTKSRWEWENRRIYLIKLEKSTKIENRKKLSIDIESDDI